MSFLLELLFEAALTVAGFFLLWFLLRARIRRFLELDSLLEGVRDEARALVIELNESADRSVNLVEDRIKALNDLLDEVDRRMGLARREIEKRAVERELYTKLAQRRPIVPRESGPSVQGLDLQARRDIERPLRAAAPIREEKPEPRQADTVSSPAAAERGFDEAGGEPIPLALRSSIPEMQGQRSGSDEARSSTAPEDRQRRVPELHIAEENLAPGPSMREQAVELYRKGFSADIIAARLGVTVAEIELLVEMEERRSGI